MRRSKAGRALSPEASLKASLEAPAERAPCIVEARFRHDLGEFQLNVAFSIERCGVTVLFGPSGSGKSTLLRCLAGLERPKDAKLRVNGDAWHDSSSGKFLPPHRRSIGMVFQEPSLFDHMTVRQNLLYGHDLSARRPRSGAPEGRKEERLPTSSIESVMSTLGLHRYLFAMDEVVDQDLSELVSLLGIGHLLDRGTHGLSGGEKQRIGIARALLRKPDMLLMDEPLASLDVHRKQEILPYIERLSAKLTIPILYVTHSPEEAIRLGDRLLIMEAGRMVAQGDPKELLRHLAPSHDDVFSEFDAQVVELEPDGLSRLRIGAGEFFIFSEGSVPGESVRCRVSSGDVSISLTRSDDTSIMNILRCAVVEVRRSSVPAHVLVGVVLDGSDCMLYARITERSCRRLNLVPGMSVWAQIKTVALNAVGV